MEKKKNRRKRNEERKEVKTDTEGRKKENRETDR
jgi:hypothetical protein